MERALCAKVDVQRWIRTYTQFGSVKRKRRWCWRRYYSNEALL
eukprot:COSAG02_NODE_21472_length_786_cov_310.042213_2_plen_42_part_01